MNKLFPAIALSILLFCCCNNEGSSPEPATADTTPVAEGENPPPSDTVRSELADFSHLKRDSLAVMFNGNADTLYGFSSGDTLHVEGDMLVEIDPITKGVGTTHRLWPKVAGFVVIPFEINPNYPLPDTILAAMKMWSDGAKVKFVEHTSQVNYVEFIPSAFTQSFVGMINGRQTIELANWAKKGNIAHEIGHCMGIYHEQSRKDRSFFVRIVCPDNVNYKHAYKKDPFAIDVGPYNYFSIMHYPPTDCMEIIKQDLPKGIPGQRDIVTADDHSTLKKIYKLN